MPNLEVKRKLAAVLIADVEGYSRLMGEDEVGTIRTLSAYRRMISKLVQQHRGRVVDATGDNLLAEFASVVDGVNCAVEIQRELAEKNQELPENKRMQFRIGVNLGDVVEEEDRIYGDGVNIAARLESICDGGSVCISGTAFEHVENKLDLEYEDLGEHDVKNITKPVRVYRVLSYPGAAAHRVIKAKKAERNKWYTVTLASAAVLIIAVGFLLIWSIYMRPSMEVEPASLEKMVYPLPDKPSIAVLPFDNMSGDPDQEYIADGFTENIITGLSQIPEMFVIARYAVFTYKGKPVKIKQVSEELGVRYVLEGGIQRAGNRLRITAQLIDAIEGHHLWAQRYDRELKDLFNLQDEITMEILTALEMKLTLGELANWYRTDNFEAWSNFTKGFTFTNRLTKEDLFRARKHFEQAKNLDPEYAPAWTMLAWTHTIEVLLGFSKSPDKSIQRALDLAQKTAELGEDQARLHSLMNRIYRVQGKFDEAIAEGKKAVALNPNYSRPHIFLAESLHYGGRPGEAIIYTEKAMRLEPFYPAWFLVHLAGPYEMLGRYEEAIAIWKQFLERSLRGEFPPIYAHKRLALNYARLDRMEKARAHVAEILKIKPDYTVGFYRKTTPYKDQKYLDSLVALLVKAGLPEHPPLQLPDKPSIAVLPFVNMSDDPKQGYFSDGIAEEIITALSKVPKIFVIARNSSFTYKGKAVKVQQVGRELGVKFLLEGSVRKSGNRVRITAQLIDATTGHHLWAERYGRELKEIFALQDEITMKIIAALRVELTDGEQARLRGKGTENLQAYLKWLRTSEHFNSATIEGLALARRLLEETISLDPEFPQAYSLLGAIHVTEVFYGSSTSPTMSLKRAAELTKKAIALDDSIASAHSYLGLLYTFSGTHDRAIAECERAVTLDPNNAWAHIQLSRALRFAGRHEEAVRHSELAFRFNPIPSAWYFRELGMTYLMTGRYDEAMTTFKKGLNLAPSDQFTHLSLTVAYIRAGREDEARAEAGEALKLNPKFSLEELAKKLKYRNKADIDFKIRALRKAGLK